MKRKAKSALVILYSMLASACGTAIVIFHCTGTDLVIPLTIAGLSILEAAKLSCELDGE